MAYRIKRTKKRKYVFTQARRKAIKKARKVWMAMKPKARRKAMPPKKYKELTEYQIKKKVEKAGKRYVPIGGYAWLDVGRPKHTYILVQKVKHGWKKIRKVKYKKGKPHPVGLKGRRVWMKMPSKLRKQVMPERKERPAYKRVKRKGRYVWIKKKR